MRTFFFSRFKNSKLEVKWFLKDDTIMIVRSRNISYPSHSLRLTKVILQSTSQHCFFQYMVTNNQVFQNGNNKQQEAQRTSVYDIKCSIQSTEYTEKNKKTPHWDPQRLIKQYSVWDIQLLASSETSCLFVDKLSDSPTNPTVYLPWIGQYIDAGSREGPSWQPGSLMVAPWSN